MCSRSPAQRDVNDAGPAGALPPEDVSKAMPVVSRTNADIVTVDVQRTLMAPRRARPWRMTTRVASPEHMEHEYREGDADRGIRRHAQHGCVIVASDEEPLLPPHHLSET